MPVEWVDPATLLATAGDEARAADFNTVLDNLSYLYDPPRCALRLTAPQEVADGSDHTVDWDEAVWDSHGDMWDSGGPSSVLATRPGLLSFNLTVEWDLSASGGKRAAYLHKNGDRLRKFHELSADGVSPFASSNTIETNCAVGDSFTIVTRQLSGTALDLVAARTVLTVRWVAAAPSVGE